jgi:hypothetical protein
MRSRRRPSELTAALFRRLAPVGVLSLALLSCRAAPPAPAGLAGTWVMTLDQRPFMVLTLEGTGDAIRSGTLQGTLHWATTDGVTFTGVEPGPRNRPLSAITMRDGHLNFTIEDPTDKSNTDSYVMTLAGTDRATLAIDGAPFEPWPLARSSSTPPPAVASDWRPELTYTLLVEPGQSSAEMAAIYEADQKPRQDPHLSPAQLAAITRDDVGRRARTARLLADGALHTGIDFEKAAFIFQHGETPDDFLLAHSLATIALAKGNRGATWIAAATLDRYLHSIERPQIYGTQFRNQAAAPITQEPFNRTLISDELRRQLGVPALAAQQQQLEGYQAAQQDQLKRDK